MERVECPDLELIQLTARKVPMKMRKIVAVIKEVNLKDEAELGRSGASLKDRKGGTQVIVMKKGTLRKEKQKIVDFQVQKVVIIVIMLVL